MLYSYEKDKEFLDIVGDILENEEFCKIKNIDHHGITRYEHSVKVAYLAYKISKFLGLNYISVARAGLLHDFFLSNENRKFSEKFISTFTHPKKAVRKSNETFGINELEKDIIKTHMFPVNLSVPRYAESWIVNITDKVIGSYEFGIKFRGKISYAVNLYFLFIINFLK